MDSIQSCVFDSLRVVLPSLAAHLHTHTHSTSVVVIIHLSVIGHVGQRVLAVARYLQYCLD